MKRTRKQKQQKEIKTEKKEEKEKETETVNEDADRYVQLNVDVKIKTADYGLYYDDIINVADEGGKKKPAAVFDPRPYTPLARQVLTDPVPLYPFKMEYFQPDYTIVLFGKRRSGKTTAAFEICRSIRRWYPRVEVFTATKSDGEWQKIVPDKAVHHGYSEERMRQIIDGQKELLTQMYERKLDYETNNVNYLIVLDDCGAENIDQSKALKDLFYCGRHYRMGIMVLLQDTKGIRPALRANVDIACMWHVSSRRDVEAIKLAFFDFLENDACFGRLQADVCQDRQVLISSHSNPELPAEENVYIGKFYFEDPPKRPPFVMGHRTWWTKGYKQMREKGMEGWFLENDWGLEPSTWRGEAIDPTSWLPEKWRKAADDCTGTILPMDKKFLRNGSDEGTELPIPECDHGVQEIIGH